jgi:hypothetical protein
LRIERGWEWELGMGEEVTLQQRSECNEYECELI